MLRSALPPVRFLADCMLGRLAKWLRILGEDCRYEARADDADIVRIAEEESRVILTRDLRLTHRRRARRFLLVESTDPDAQIRQVVAAFSLALDPARVLSRCLRCNEPLVGTPREEAIPAVPPFVAATQTSFARCPGCGRLYWGATHRDEVLRRIERVFRGVPPGASPSGG